jgi:4-hydroxy-2-oxoheptanedioate aldolase
MTVVPFAERLARGDRLLGTFVKSADLNITELLAGSGLDFLIADHEHSSLGVREIEGIARAAGSAAIPLIVRLASGALAETGRLLDAGASGIQVADVHDMAAPTAACRQAAYPPDGQRGLALSHRAARFGREPLADYLDRAARENVVICQIESIEGAAALPTLLAARLPVNAWFLGPTDLSASLGRPGQLDHPEVVERLEQLATTILDAKAPLGIYARNLTEAQAWSTRGATLIALGSDYTLLATQVDSIVQSWRQSSTRS